MGVTVVVVFLLVVLVVLVVLVGITVVVLEAQPVVTKAIATAAEDLMIISIERLDVDVRSYELPVGVVGRGLPRGNCQAKDSRIALCGISVEKFLKIRADPSWST